MEASSVARQIFEDIDVNGDRVLSSDELRAWLERKGEEALSNQLFALLDTDGDGVVTFGKGVALSVSGEAADYEDIFG